MLPGLIQALRGQTHAVGRIVGVDTGSRDRSGAVLAEMIGQDAVFGMDRATGFGQAVWGALRRAPAVRPDSSGQQQVEWIWLLHDDCEPAPETLERLLRAASKDRTVVVLGPKVLDGTDRRVLREVGISIDRSGRRVTGIDLGEYDQGQHDHNRAVLAVGSAGMLVRRDVWERLDGFDTHLRLGTACRSSPTPSCTTASSPPAGAGCRRGRPPAGWTGVTRCTCWRPTCPCCPCSRRWPGASPGHCCAPRTSR
jgi:GT2 family glycosyltransferase